MNSHPLSQIHDRLARIEAKVSAPAMPADLSVNEAAEALRCSRKTVWRYMKLGLLKKNRRGRIPARMIQDLLR